MESSGENITMNNKKHLFDNPKNVKLLVKILVGCCIVLFAMDFIIHRHTVHPWESFTGFYALYGFLACVVLVLLARELRKLVMRDEDYYITNNIDKSEKESKGLNERREKK